LAVLSAGKSERGKKENAYFADGIQVTAVEPVPLKDLKVISRTWCAYKSGITRISKKSRGNWVQQRGRSSVRPVREPIFAFFSGCS